MTPDQIVGVVRALRQRIRQAEIRETRLREKIDELRDERNELRHALAVAREQILCLRNDLVPQLPRGPQPKYATQAERIAARRKTWRDYSRRKRLAS